jgi:hypothetical protein
MEKEKSKSTQEQLNFDPGAIKQIMINCSQTEEHGEAKAHRNGCSITIYPEQCITNSIAEPVELGFEELDSNGELRAYQATGGIAISDEESDGESKPLFNISHQALMVCFAKEALRTLNGVRLNQDQKYVVWNMLRMNGRMTCGQAYMAGCTGGKKSADFTIKSLASLKLY